LYGELWGMRLARATLFVDTTLSATMNMKRGWFVLLLLLLEVDDE
jgi:hypothetical protein